MALRETIHIHGQINKRLIGSAAKRITGILLAKDKKNESLPKKAADLDHNSKPWRKKLFIQERTVDE